MRSIIAAACALCLCPLAVAGKPAETPPPPPAPTPKAIEVEGPIVIQLQENVPVRVKAPISGVALGSSQIASVVVHDEQLLFVTGRAYGVTTLHVVDQSGRVVLDTRIHVVDASPSRLTLTKAGSNFTYDCTPKCQPAPNIGDESEYFQTNVTQASSLGNPG